MPRIKIVRTGGKVAFNPDPAAVNLNDRVFWLNDDTEDHQISLTGQKLKPGDTSSAVQITANQDYHCEFHPQETGSITVAVGIRIVRTGGKVAFNPDPATVNANNKVFWFNDDTVDHQISLAPELLKPGEYSSAVLITENQAYSCLLHPDEKGSITIAGVA
jgi:plastocyanin